MEALDALEVASRLADGAPPENDAEARARLRRRRLRDYWNNWCWRRRVALLEKLGGKCVDCGETWETRLEFDHLKPRTWTARSVSQKTRIRRYEDEASRGLITIRCGDCNKKKGKPRRFQRR